MNRCFLEQDAWRKTEIELSDEESHHLLTVLRARPGETIEIFDGRGRVAGAKLVSGRGGGARLKISPESVRMFEPDPVSITLLQAVPKHAAMEEIIQKTVELGVQKIIPVITARVVVKFKNKHIERWQKIVLAAAKQCHAAWLPEISDVTPLAEAARAAREDLKIFGALDPGAPALKKCLRNFNGMDASTNSNPVLKNDADGHVEPGRPRPLPAEAALQALQADDLRGLGSGRLQLTTQPRALKSIALAIGPEGDFTAGERDLLAAAGFKPAGFGSRVLRVETAALFGLSALNYEFRSLR